MSHNEKKLFDCYPIIRVLKTKVFVYGIHVYVLYIVYSIYSSKYY